MPKTPQHLRPLRDDERALLDHLLRVEMPGVEELRAQTDFVQVVGDRVEIWHIPLWVPDDAPPAKSVFDESPILAPAKGGPEQGADVSIWMDGWYLGAIELAWWERDPTRLPRPEELEPALRSVVTG